MKERISVKRFVKMLTITGFLLAVIILFASFITQFFALKSNHYYLLNEISIELIHTARKCAGVTSLGGFLLSFIDR